MTKARPVPTHPTNADLAVQITDIHACMEKHAASATKDRHDARNRDMALDDKLGKFGDDIKALTVAVGSEAGNGGLGSGLVGRMGKIETRVKAADDLVLRIQGGIVVSTVLLSAFGFIIWFLEGHKIAQLFGVAS